MKLRRLCAVAFKAFSDCADSMKTSGPACGLTGFGSGAFSTTTCAFTPPNPNELTPATRRDCADQSRISSTSSKGVPSSLIAGFTACLCRSGINVPWRICRSILIKPTSPAATSAWPTWDLTLDRAMLPEGETKLSTAFAIPANSMGSPTAVPVPCSSIAPTSCGVTPASCQTCSINACCAWAFGANKELDLPEWFTPDPRITP